MSRNLDALIAAQVMGFVWTASRNGKCRALAPGDGQPANTTLPQCGDWDRDVPAFSSDPKVCREAEQIVMLNLGLEREYLAALQAEYKRFAVSWISWDRYLLEVDPAARCKAMLAALNSAAAKYQGVEMQYVINRLDGRHLSQTDVDAIEERLNSEMVAWLEAHGLGMSGGCTPYQDDKKSEVAG